MRSTLFFVPMEVAGIPLLGFGLLLALWTIVGIGTLIWNTKQGASASEQWGLVPFWGLVAAAIVFVMPGLVEYAINLNGDQIPLGIPIRGFGVMMMLGTIGGVMLAIYRAQRMGIHPDVIYSLAMWMFGFGMLGARVFYFVQYRDDIQGDNLQAWLVSFINVQNGGLVVYGALLGAVPAGFWYLYSHKLPILAIADIIAPSMVVGLALGRIGCFLNGCCYGGYCAAEPIGFRFPVGSPPYMQHMEQGYASGIWVAEEAGSAPQVTYVDPASPAAEAGVKSGLALKDAKLSGKNVTSAKEVRDGLLEGGPRYELTVGKDRFAWTASPPKHSVPIHATQLYAALDAGLLAAFLWFAFPLRKHDGQIFAALLMFHAISRFLLELIRNDEGGQFGSGLTISQLGSIGIFIAGLALMLLVMQKQTGKALPKRSQLVAAT